VLVLRIGLTVGALGFLYVAWRSWSAGYAPEVAFARGFVAFMAASIVAYLGELVVATAPRQAHGEADASDNDGDAFDLEAPPEDAPNRMPVSIRAEREERRAA
jgi:hypothetical protein